MEVLKSACYFVGVLSLLIVAHEWGHFIVAKMCRMRVDDFSLFFGPRLLCLGKRKGTEYNIRSIPLGGFVKIAGMEPEDSCPASMPIIMLPADSPNGTAWMKYQKSLVGLRGGAFENIDFNHVSERCIQLVSSSIGSDSRLTANGRAELQSQLASSVITKDEDLYLQSILAAREPAPDPENYREKPIWQRAAVISAGPIMSLIFGYFLFCIMGFTTGLPDVNNDHLAIGVVSPDKPAAQAGLMPGDWITAVNGKDTPNYLAALYAIRSSVDPQDKRKGLPITVTVNRSGHLLTLGVTPGIEQDEQIDADGKPIKDKLGKVIIGPVAMIGISVDRVWTRYNLIDSVRQGTSIIDHEVRDTITGIFSRDVKNNVGGIITIGKVINENSKQGPNHVLFTAAMLSVSLGILNLFPIPVLDGGHLVLLLAEWISRRRLTTREVYSAQMVGLVIIGVLFVFVMYNDLLRLVKRQ